MARREFIAGPNFSGRSAALRGRLQERQIAGNTFFVGPYAEAALSGLTSTVRDEVALYRGRQTTERPAFAAQDVATLVDRDPQSLSGGEQVLLALHCFSQSDYPTIAIDTALEQLDAVNRAAALDYLSSGNFDAFLIDNRTAPEGWPVTSEPESGATFAIDWTALADACAPRDAPVIAVSGLNFSYRGGKTIFSDAAVVLEPGHAYRVAGANGAGKTTFFKLLVGALVPESADMMLGGERYLPWRNGNRALALATQNPDQQWCGATLREDMTRRRKVLRGGAAADRLAETRVARLAEALGGVSLDAHLYELPLAARKRLSWTWPFAGVHPWIMLDEPTVGQDRATREALARHLALMCAHGYGVMFVTHDDEFAALMPHRGVLIADRSISLR
jgi:energy-coupling factor transport system ATP-binding protein